MATRTIVHSGLNEQVYRLLRERILDGGFPPGARIRVEELCRDYAVSPTPIKDALRLLSGEGLVDLRPRYGVFVTVPTAKDMGQIFDLRRTLEFHAADDIVTSISPEAIRSLTALLSRGRALSSSTAASGATWREFLRVDEEFHDGLIRAADNRHLLDLYRRLLGHRRIAMIHLPDTVDRMRRAQHDHETILAAVIHRTPERYRASMARHLDQARRNLITQMQQQEVKEQLLQFPTKTGPQTSPRRRKR